MWVNALHSSKKEKQQLSLPSWAIYVFATDGYSLKVIPNIPGEPVFSVQTNDNKYVKN